MALLLLLGLVTLTLGVVNRIRHQGEQRSRAARAGPFFSPTSFWNSALPSDAPLDPSSAALSGAFRDTAQQELSSGAGPSITTYGYTTPLYTVPAGQPTVRVQLDNPNVAWPAEMQHAFDAVPIPPDARPAEGTDAHLTIFQPASDKLWDFWHARRDTQGNWHAGYGGAMQDVSQSPGYYTSASWPNAPHAYGWGATASGLPVIGGTILRSELRAGHIDHALAVAIPMPRANVFSWPAQRTDGTSDSPDAIPEGARFRLDPNVDVGALDLPPLVAMMARAAQRYGIVVRDKTGPSGAIQFFVEDSTLPGSTDPFWTSSRRPSPNGYFKGLWPQQLLAKFPWGRLQLLRMRLCPMAPCAPPRQD